MLIAIIGKSFSGRKTISKYLISKHQFKVLALSSPNENDHDPGMKIEAEMNVDELMEYILKEKRWQQDYILWNLSTIEQYEVLKKRPFFMVLYIDCPLLMRYERFLKTNSEMELKDFLLKYEPDDFFNHKMMTKSSIHLFNTKSINDLYENLELHFPLKDLLRPNWDDYFMHLAELASFRSNCMKRRVGSVLVSENRVLSTGYNGTPRKLKNCSEGGCERCNGGASSGVGLDTCICLHAEENALLEVGRLRLTDPSKVTLYCNTCPCLNCCKKIVQMGIKEVVYRKAYGQMDVGSKYLFEQAGILVRQFEPRQTLFLQ